jgi:hypothetical protein
MSFLQWQCFDTGLFSHFYFIGLSWGFRALWQQLSFIGVLSGALDYQWNCCHSGAYAPAPEPPIAQRIEPVAPGPYFKL